MPNSAVGVERWLSIHRAGPITVDRKTDHQCRHIPRACISVTGGIQPKVMSRVASNPELRDNGLLARLLVAMPPRRPKQWSEAGVSEESDAAYRHIVERLLSLDFGADEHGNPVPIALSPGAKEKFVRFFNAHNCEQSLLGDDLSAAWSKLEANWTYYKGRIKERWGKLTDDELEVIDGEWDQLIGSLQVRYGMKKQEVEREVLKFLSNCSAPK